MRSRCLDDYLPRLLRVLYVRKIVQTLAGSFYPGDISSDAAFCLALYTIGTLAGLLWLSLPTLSIFVLLEFAVARLYIDFACCLDNAWK